MRQEVIARAQGFGKNIKKASVASVNEQREKVLGVEINVVTPTSPPKIYHGDEMRCEDSHRVPNNSLQMLEDSKEMEPWCPCHCP